MSDEMFRIDPEPMSKMNLSPLPSSNRKHAEACAKR
jgi:hypothetical protein